MLAIIDARSSVEAVTTLQHHVDEVFKFQSHGLTFPPLSGHPDIFVHSAEQQTIIAPNCPKALRDVFDKNAVCYIEGTQYIEPNNSKSALYNCVSTTKYFIHKEGSTDESILNTVSNKIFINVPQSFTRCSLIHLLDDKFITSDKGIERALLHKGLDCFYFNPEKISIKGYTNGCMGGTAGIYNKKIFFNGNITLHHDGYLLSQFINEAGLEIIALSKDFLYDGGGIFFFKGKMFHS